jgi:hypothetical protein
VGEVFRVGQRVRLTVDALDFRLGQQGRVVKVDRARAAAGVGESVLYFCEVNAAGGTRMAAFYPAEIEPLG